MRIFIVGSGAVGSVIAKFLSREKTVREIICGDKNPKRAKDFINFESKKLSFRMVDASNEDQMIAASKDVDLIINATLPHFNSHVIKVALKVGANYQDLCSHLDKSKTPGQLRFDAKFKKEKLVGLINTGMSPGITNILVKNSADRFDDVHSVRIRTLVDPNAIEPIFAMSPEVTLEESTSPALVYRNGKFKFVKPFEEVEYYEFPQPIGKRFVFSVYGDEVATLSRNVKTREVDFKSGGVDLDASKLFYDLGLLSDKPIRIGGASFIPLEFFSKNLPTVPTPEEMIRLMRNGIVEDALVVLVVEVDGIKSGRKVSIKKSIIFPTLKEITKILPGANYISYPTGLSAFSFSKIIPLVEEKGVILPEMLNSELRNKVLLELISEGLKINEEFSKCQ